MTTASEEVADGPLAMTPLWQNADANIQRE
jgi:hypothetical protein